MILFLCINNSQDIFPKEFGSDEPKKNKKNCSSLLTPTGQWASTFGVRLQNGKFTLWGVLTLYIPRPFDVQRGSSGEAEASCRGVVAGAVAGMSLGQRNGVQLKPSKVVSAERLQWNSRKCAIWVKCAKDHFHSSWKGSFKRHPARMATSSFILSLTHVLTTTSGKRTPVYNNNRTSDWE